MQGYDGNDASELIFDKLKDRFDKFCLTKFEIESVDMEDGSILHYIELSIQKEQLKNVSKEELEQLISDRLAAKRITITVSEDSSDAEIVLLVEVTY